jgi:hypothetical protein
MRSKHIVWCTGSLVVSTCQESGLPYVLMGDVNRGREFDIKKKFIKLLRPPEVSLFFGSHEFPKLGNKSSGPKIHLKYGL